MVHVIDDVRSDAAPLRAYDSLTQQHMAVVSRAIAAIGSAWQVDQHEDYTGHLIILITTSGCDDDGPVYVVSGRVRHIELASMYGEDDLHDCGFFSTIEAAAAALVTAIASTCPIDRLTRSDMSTGQEISPLK